MTIINNNIITTHHLINDHNYRNITIYVFYCLGCNMLQPPPHNLNNRHRYHHGPL